jgi:hypothetical protein
MALQWGPNKMRTDVPGVKKRKDSGERKDVVIFTEYRCHEVAGWRAPTRSRYNSEVRQVILYEIAPIA